MTSNLCGSSLGLFLFPGPAAPFGGGALPLGDYVNLGWGNQE